MLVCENIYLQFQPKRNYRIIGLLTKIFENT